MVSDHRIVILYDQKPYLDHQELDFINENAWKPRKFLKKKQITLFLGEIGRILMKMGPSDAEFNFQSTGTNENNTTTQKSTKTKEKQKTKQKTKTAKQKLLNIV